MIGPGKARIDRLAGPALKAFFKIAQASSMTEEEQTGTFNITSVATLQRWFRQDTDGFQRDAIQRISLVRGIYKAINLLPTNRALADRWVRAANSDPLFSGRCAMALIASDKLDELYSVRRYLDAEVYS